MVIAVGLSSYNIALFHLVNHAFYKALLFLGAGAVIHAVADNQDFRKYGGLRPFLPLTYSVMLIASLSLVAFPFMTGFYSKDFILESAYGQFYFSGTVVYFIATIGAMFTTLYSVKVLYLTFLTNPNGPLVNHKHAHEGDIFMSLPLIILAIFSIFFGYITKDIFIGLGSGFFADNSLFIHPTHEIMLDTEFAVPTFFKLLPLFFTISLSVLAIILSEFLPKIILSFKFSRLGYNIFGFFNQRFLIELFYNKYVTGLILKLGGQTTKVIDKGSVELLGPYGLEKSLITLSRNIASLDTKVITSYALYILLGIIFNLLIPSLAIIDNSLLLLLIILAMYFFKSGNTSLTKGIYSPYDNKNDKQRVKTPQNMSALINEIVTLNIDIVSLKLALKRDIKYLNFKLLSLTNKVSIDLGFYLNNVSITNTNIPLFKDAIEYLSILKMYQSLMLRNLTDKHEFKLNPFVSLSDVEIAELKAMHNYLTVIDEEVANGFSSTDFPLYINKRKISALKASRVIKRHNEKIVLVGKDELELRRNFLTFWGYNTPSVINYKVTPLTGTAIDIAGIKDDYLAYKYNNDSDNFFILWLSSYYYLILTANITVNALEYYKANGSNINLLNLKPLFDAWNRRQIYYLFHGEGILDTQLKGDRYVHNFISCNNVILRELLEDSLYILLNIILAECILYALNSNKPGITEDEYWDLVTNTISNHYVKYSVGYSYLEKLRIYNFSNYVSLSDAKLIPVQ